MEILASCTLEESKKYNGKLVIPCEDKKSPDKVSINVVVDDGDTDVYKGLSGNEKCITFVNEPADFCPTELQGNVFNEYTLDDLLNARVKEVEGIVSLVRLEKDYSDMRVLCNYTKKYPNIRFIGGNLLGVEGVNIGRYDKGKDKMSPVFNEMYDTFLEVSLKDLDGIQEIIKRNKKKVSSMSGSTKSKKSKEKKVSKRKVAFSNLFGNSEGVDF